MKKIFVLTAVLVFAVSQVFAANFVPTKMVISAPSHVLYNFEGADVTIPIKVTGQPASAIFLVFTKDQAGSVSKIQNGYLGWHYVNKIDTCVYASEPIQMDIGTNNYTWKGKDNDGKNVAENEYNYYVWGFDNVNFKIPVTRQISPNPWGRITVMTHDEAGKMLNQPIIWGGSGHRGGNSDGTLAPGDNVKWIVGSDPDDASMKETCTTYEVADPGGLAFNPEDFDKFYKCGLDNMGNKAVWAWSWVPNGEAEKILDFGDDGVYKFSVNYPVGWEFGPGIVNDGGPYLITTNGDLSGTSAESELIFIDFEGSEVQRLDLSDWYVDLNDAEAGGQSSSGPATLNTWGTYVVTGAHSTCLNALIDIYYEDEDDAIIWANSNGDYTGDHNFEEDSEKPWVCNDYNVGPYKYNIPIEKNGFSFFPSFDMGAVSFGLYAPDGTGLGYHALAAETAKQKLDTSVISGGSAYDGLLVSNNSQETDTTGWFWVGYDTFKGVISSQVAVDEAAPAAFAVAQNSPNPFNPTTTINFNIADAGIVSVDVFNVAGQKVDTIANEFMNAGNHTVNWDASAFSAGVYFYTVKSGDFSKTMKMTLLK
ncbi:MAG: T9SS type A sorting domain-containing protein [Candidatus Latescibacteria bacterium]|nr:T9SS type A sorting domain-containing protein [Candidatus Latescibacterota bacterium]